MPEPTPLPLTKKGTGSADWWNDQIEWCTDVRKGLLTNKWRPNVNAYTDDLAPPRPHGIRVNVQFEKVEQKRHQLMWRLPVIKLRPSPRTIRDAMPTEPGGPPRDLKKSVAIFREFLTYLIGRRHANLQPIMEEVIFDVLCPSGIGFVKIGYERYADGTRDMATGAMIDDPKYQPAAGNILKLRPAPKIAEMAQVPNVVSERYYGSRISPANALWPMDFTKSDFTRAPFLGHEFWQTTEQLDYRKWTHGAAGSDANDDDHRITTLNKAGHRNDQHLCRELYYYGHDLDPINCPHPDKIRRLVFVSGVKEPVVHEDCRDQRFDERSGKLLVGLRTLPIKVLTLRYVSDAAVPPSDCSIIGKTSDELAEYLTQLIEHRRRAVPIRGINIDEIIDERMKEKLRTAILNGEYLPDIFTSGVNIDKLISVFAPPTYPSDNFAGFNILMSNVNRALALGANQSSVKEQGGTTATEIASIDRASGARLGAEAEKVVSVFFMSLVEAFGDLVQLHADEDDYVEVVGEGGAKSVEVMNKAAVRGEFLYEAVPDSAMQPDAAKDRDLSLNRFNLTINNPHTNQKELLRDTFEAMNADPDRLVTDPPPPPPEKPRITLSFNGKDFDPSVPQYANVVNLLTVAGIPATLAPTQPGGAPPEGEETGPANVVDRERLRMAEADATDERAGGLVGVGG